MGDNYWSKRGPSALTRRRVLGGFALGAAGTTALGLVGCGNASSTNNSTSTAAGGNGATAQPKDGGTYSWEYTYPITSFVDPHVAGSGGSFLWQFAGNVAVRYDATGKTLTPELFQSWESPDGATHVITVRPNVKTHNVPLTNARVFDAQDVAANLMRISGLSDQAHVTQYWLRGTVPGMVSATAVDDTHVQVKFDKPTPFPYGLTNYLATFIPRENFADANTLRDPTKISGTGPWIVSEFRASQSITFKPNPDFWGGHAPHFQSAVLRQSGDRVSQMSSFIQGNATYFENPSKVERDTINKSLANSHLFAWPGSTCAYTIFNTQKAPFTDPRVRQAMHLATNYTANEDAYWGQGFYTLAGVLNNAFADALQPDQITKMPGWRSDKTQDIKDANDMLTAAGFPGGKGLSFAYMSANLPTQQAYGYDFAVRQLDNWKQAFPSIDVKFDLAADATAQTQRINGHDFQVANYGGVSAAPAAVDLAQNAMTKGASNFSQYSNPDVDNLLSKALQSQDNNEIANNLKQAQDTLLKDLPFVIMHRLWQAGIYAPAVTGFPTIQGGSKPLEGNFENWNSVHRHSAVEWLNG